MKIIKNTPCTSVNQNMKMRSACAAAGLSLVMFLGLSLVFGQTGLRAIQAVTERQTALQSNISDLESHHRALTARLQSLRTDPDSVMVEARNLGLYRKNDMVLTISNREGTRNQPEAGGVLVLPPIQQYNEDILRLLSLSAGLLSLLVLLIRDRPAHGPAKKS